MQQLCYSQGITIFYDSMNGLPSVPLAQLQGNLAHVSYVEKSCRSSLITDYLRW